MKIKLPLNKKILLLIILTFILFSLYIQTLKILLRNIYLNNINLDEWIKYDKNPILGGNFGTIFDVSVLKIKKTYYMFSSWRPKGRELNWGNLSGFNGPVWLS